MNIKLKQLLIFLTSLVIIQLVTNKAFAEDNNMHISISSDQVLQKDYSFNLEQNQLFINLPTPSFTLYNLENFKGSRNISISCQENEFCSLNIEKNELDSVPIAGSSGTLTNLEDI
jgi:hypothetical protein